MTIFYEKIYGWGILTLFLLKGAQSSCNVNNCDLEYCNGDGCIKCKDGYYLSGTSCYRCRSNCVTCTGYYTCTECVKGKYGTTCESSCSSRCPACISSSLCTECIPGRHAATCNSYCPESCIDILCEKDTAKCSLGCRHGYYNSGDDCNECPEHCTRCTDSTLCSDCDTGFYGSYCQTPCPLNCKSQACDKVHGYCTQGCIDRYYQDGNNCHECPYKCMTCTDENTCSECKTGYWGPQCQYDCPITCNKCTQEGQCSQITNCDVSNCTPDYCVENSCIKCMDGYYLSGFSCYQCPSYCTKCTSSSSCTECEYGRYGTKCESTCRTQCPDCVGSFSCTVCIPGRYGSYCQFYSPLSCIDMLSDKTTGKCVFGCRHGYYGVEDECYTCPENCKRCANNTYCTICEQGFFGNYCQWACPSSCRDQACDKEFGLCTGGCVEGYFLEGTNCSSCPHRCARCSDRSSCTVCKTGYWGQTCEKDCPEVCYKCGQDGQCVSVTNCDVSNCAPDYCVENSCIKCKDGYYLSGFSCYQCPSYCTKCTSSSSCTECEYGRYGTKCESTCRTQCPECVGYSNCTVCIPGRYGSYCQFYSPLSCIDMLSDKTTGKCVLGCRHGYYGLGEECYNCPENCKRCADNSHCTVCEQGFFGNYCQWTCPSSCRDHACDKDLGLCTGGCIDGYFLEGTNCSSCPHSCVRCSDSNSCTLCKTGYWGQTCEKDCPEVCYKCGPDGQCVSVTNCDVSNCAPDYCVENSCIKCMDGYYLSGFSCYQCPSYCTKCTSSSSCTECKYGRYGTKCESTCRTQCPDCVSYSNCTVCIPGRYGSYCQHYSPLSCIDMLSDKTTGKCVLGCRHGYYGLGEECYKCPENCKKCADNSYCTICEQGFFGNYCQWACPSSCRDQACDKEFGLCTGGCVEGYFLEGTNCSSCPLTCVRCSDSSICTLCKTGYWGQTCEKHCPEVCYRCGPDGQCVSGPQCDVNNCLNEYCWDSSCIKCRDGYYLSSTYCYSCPSHCTKCSSSSSCSECEYGKYGTKCDFTCPSRCRDCISSSNCTECVPGRHGSNCQTFCPLGCIDILCVKETGKCLLGCKHGYYKNGDDCPKCPEHCTRCSDATHCKECKTGWYGSYCQNECPKSCKEQECDKELGTCLEGCIAEYYPTANTCTRCPDKCMICSDVDTCTECITGYWGQQCQADCPSTCYKCTKDGGNCVSNYDCNVYNCDREYCSGSSCLKCKDGNYLSGGNCFQCPQTCTKCSSYSTCQECVLGKYGSDCKFTCSDRCVGCVSFSQCVQCIPGRHGSNCQLFCSLGCIDILCDKDSGRCTRGCKHGYYLSGTECTVCSEHCTKCISSNHCTDCESGYYGTFCQSTCHQSCLNQICGKDSGECTDGCIEGYYPDGNSCVTCPNPCVSCTNARNCTECKTGFWGLECQFDCPVDCLECDMAGECTQGGTECYINNCKKDYCSDNSCIQCQDGYYLSGTYCYQCKQYCTKCSSSSSCSECVQGRYGYQCDSACSSVCLGCTSSSDCTACIAGRYGSACQSYCPLGCNNILCDKNTGKCTEGCRPGFYALGADCNKCPEACARCFNGSVCSLCRSGYYGTNCHRTCPPGCKDSTCHKETGHCTAADCIRGFYYNQETCIKCPEKCASCVGVNNCTQCNNGYWGTECKNYCPETCIRCTILGQCIDDPACYVSNCDRRYCSGNGCIKCEDGYYLSGTNCYKCPSNCLKCTDTYNCTECVRGSYGSNCILTCKSTCIECTSSSQCGECIPGRYGSACELTCPLSCKGIVCDKSSGKCTAGCNEGYYSSEEECYDCPDQCARCSNNSYCNSCVPGYHGALCQKTCPDGCRNQLCDVVTGNCTDGCATGYYFNLGLCIKDPDNSCYVNNCDRTYCSGNSCIKCEGGYFLSGTNCYKCPSNCLKCTDTYNCTECVRGTHGRTCISTCKSTCIDCTSSSQCGECIPGRYGSACELTCPLSCKGIVCDKISGKCTAGCNEGYYSSGEECNDCPDQCARCSNNSYCNSCVPGYHGAVCQKTCPVGCRNQLCDVVTGNCTDGCATGYHFNLGFCVKDPDNACYVNNCDRTYCSGNGCIKCEDGFFLSGTNCYKCPSNCLKCTDTYNCTECVRGTYGSTCISTCKSTCIDCTSSSQCGECIPGRYGSACELTCPLSCKGIVCDKISGKCTAGCNEGYYSSGEECNDCPDQCTRCSNNSYCYSCIPGYHGAMCQKTCPVGCRNQLCDIVTGNCTDGCATGYHLNLGYCVEDLDPSECTVAQCVQGHCFGSTCTKCNDGYYVEELRCHKCPDNCIKCSSSTQCEECTTGKQGSICQFLCSLGCKDSVCNSNGFCTEGCNEGYIMTRGECQSCPRHCTSCSSVNNCSKCSVGYWGPFCQYECLGCNSNGCGRITDCVHGCIDGYYEHVIGEGRFECAKCSQNCQKCSNSDNCSVCNAGYWGSKCNIQCNANCKDKSCNLDNGHCSEGCENGYYGNTCLHNCLAGCELCDSGESCITCVVGKYGSVCEKDCSANCFKIACFRNNGSCVYGCLAGFSGDTCSKEKATSTGQTDKQEGSDSGAAIGLGVVFAIALSVICVLVFFLLRRRQSNKHTEEDFRSPTTVINQTYDTTIGTSNIKDLDRRRTQGEDNLAVCLDAADQGHMDSSHGNRSHGNLSHSNPNYDATGSRSVDDGEYAVIQT